MGTSPVTRTNASSRVDENVAAAMARVNDLFNREVVSNRNFSALDQVYTADARILPPGAPMISGRDAIRDFWRNVVEYGNMKSAVLSTVDAMRSGDGIVEIGKASITAQSGEHPWGEMDVKYVVFWTRENGEWKWQIDIWNMSA